MEEIIIVKRRIEKVDRERKSKKMLTIVLVFITSILLMTSILEMVVNRDTQNYEQGSLMVNNYTLTRSSSGWSLEYENEKLDFTLSPLQVDYLNLSEDVLDKIERSIVFYYSVNSSSEIVPAVSFAVLESSYNAQKVGRIKLLYGFEDAPNGKIALDCKNQTNAPIFIFRKGEEFKVINDGENEFCHYVYATNEFDVISFSNAIAYLKLGVIDKEFFSKE